MKIVFEPDGTATALDFGGLVDGDLLSKRRVSHIVPVNMAKRIVFVVLRNVFGEAGKVAAWTRTWTGPWRATLVDSGESFTAATRDECLSWEIRVIESRM